MRSVPASALRWLVPVAASVGVAALFVGLAVLVHPSSAGPGPDRALRLGRDSPVAPKLPPAPTDEGRRNGGIEITGYQSSGRTLSLFYDVKVRGCAGQIDPPRVHESARAVVVEIRRRQTDSSQQACGNLLLQDAVEVRLERPLAGRLVRDAGRRMALVPPKASIP